MAGPILRLKDMIAHTGLSRSVIYERMNEKSTRYAKDFPKSFSLDGGAIGWFQSEVDAWLESCAANGKRGTKSQKANPSADSKGLATQVPATPSELAESSKPVRKPSQQPTSASKHPTSKSPAKRSARPGNLADAIVEGGQINDRILHYLQMKEWTPAMGAMLISGINPQQECHAIPEGGIGLDGLELHTSNARFNDARRILRQWFEWKKDAEEKIDDIEPIRYLNWCRDENITSEWLRLALDLAGMGEISSADLTASRFALLTNR